MELIKNIGLLILSFLGFIIIATVVGIGTLVLFFIAQLWLSGEKNYLLFVSSNWNMITVILLEFFVVYLLVLIKDKFTKEKISKKDKNLIRRFQRSPRFFKIAYIVVLIIITYCGITSYTVLYESSIKVSSPLSPVGVTYSYSDVTSVDVGLRRTSLKDYTPYYRIKFNNDKSTDLFGGSMDEQKGRFFEDILIEFDNELKAQGVSKSANKKNFEKYSKGLDKEFVSKIEKLFQ